MGIAMTNSQLFAKCLARSAAELLDDSVTAFRNRGFTREAGIEQAALALGIPVNRAKALLYGRLYSVAADEYQAIHARFLTHLDEGADSLARRSAEARVRRKQMEMDL